MARRSPRHGARAGGAPARHRRLRDADVLRAARRGWRDAFGRLASGGLGPAGEQLATAMTATPSSSAFDGALDTELMRAHHGLVAKIGAEGVLGIGLPDGRGARLKVLDGAMRGLDTAALLVLEERLGVSASAGSGCAMPRWW